jgi:hypothetical protein
VDLVLFSGLLVNICNEACQAADAVAAHLRLAAVAVEDAHCEVSLTDSWQGKDHLKQQQQQQQKGRKAAAASPMHHHMRDRSRLRKLSETIVAYVLEKKTAAPLCVCSAAAKLARRREMLLWVWPTSKAALLLLLLLHQAAPNIILVLLLLLHQAVPEQVAAAAAVPCLLHPTHKSLDTLAHFRRTTTAPALLQFLHLPAAAAVCTAPQRAPHTNQTLWHTCAPQPQCLPCLI